jgi:outer membrane PBP1 activator LpoA protein
MSRLCCLLILLAAVAVVGCASHGSSDSNVTVRVTGDAQAYGVYTSNRGFGGR